jgi:hypothetical protein
MARHQVLDLAHVLAGRGGAPPCEPRINPGAEPNFLDTDICLDWRSRLG